MDEISDYYNNEAFKDVHKLVKIEAELIETEIKNMFFLLKRGFNFAFAAVLNGNEKNGYKINAILVRHQDFISRRLISFVL